ncbi:MucR family transcriptional regulator [Allomesorhizobium alhagi]|uniref:MucR family transcriptional regulator n=1 Tax=Mesorhizobium alhagi CCNWXJ12-2 TaxID=1107882 RepID=H0I1N0_9HYPH|nr:MucR family transcriptional regulator [Mesorhizobium alhagi]EHK53094.1 MucR family transcriptional regulator [Mesorhizobium alhagi CCNWXJ12-2]
MVETAAQPDVEIVVEIVSAYVSNNAVPVEALPDLIASVAAAVGRLTKDITAVEAKPLKPAVPVKESLTADYVVCLEDGKKFKSIKRHLASRHGMTPDEYRAKWKLPADYPMVAPSYTAARSRLAKKMGLGRKRR